LTEHDVSPIFDGIDIVNTIARRGETDAAEEFLTNVSPRVTARYERYFARLRDGHHLKSPEHMAHIKQVRDPHDKGAEVHELKVHMDGGYRLYVVRFEGRWYATHGVRKGSDRAVPKEARKAFAIFWGD